MECKLTSLPPRYRAVYFALTLVTALLVTFNAGYADLSWPNQTVVDWGGIEDRPCYQYLVWCILEPSTSYTTFSSLVSTNNHSIFLWNNNSETDLSMAIVEINVSDDLVTEAEDYWDNSLVRYASPVLIETYLDWPDDELFEDEQWYLQATVQNLPPNGNTTRDIDWQQIADAQSPQRGNANVWIGIIDSGISMDEEGDLNHPDLMDDDRIFPLWNYFNDNDDLRDSPLGVGHGTMIAGLIAADPNNVGPEEEENWGIVGVNTVSSVMVCRVTPQNPAQGVPNAVIMMALNDLAGSSANVVNLSMSGRNPDRGVEEAVVILSDQGIMPLLVCSVGNEGLVRGVKYPARYAWWGELAGHERGYSEIISVGANSSGAFPPWWSSYTDGHNHVSVLAPGAGPNPGNGNAGDPVSTKPPYINLGERDYFYNYAGTSVSVPLIVGIASLVYSQDYEVNEEFTLTPWAVRRIIEKTAMRTGSIHEQDGYGIAKADIAVLNRDLYRWTLTELSWHFISSNILPARDDLYRVMEDITLDNDEEIFFQRLSTIKGWDPVNQAVMEYNPDEEITTLSDWNVQRAYKIKLKDLVGGATDSLLICGQQQAVDAEISYYDNPSNQVRSWNYIAYYPRYTAFAEDALEDIATSGDANSPLYLAKNIYGNFYAVNAGFCNLTMEPGQGYEMQFDDDSGWQTFQYPDEDPDPVPRPREKGGEHQPNSPTHFTFQSITGEFMPILITGIEFIGGEAEPDDEIGIFIDDSICVGAGVYEGEWPLGFAAWKDDPTSDALEGFIEPASLTFRYWDNSEGVEISQDNPRFSIASEEYIESGSIWIGKPKFDGVASHRIVPSEFSFGPVYPNPFNATAHVDFALPERSDVSITIYDVSGKPVSALLEGNYAKGTYTLSIDCPELASGVYLLQIQAGEQNRSLKMSLIR